MVDIWNFILPRFGVKYKKFKILNKFWIHTPPFHTYTFLLRIKWRPCLSTEVELWLLIHNIILAPCRSCRLRQLRFKGSLTWIVRLCPCVESSCLLWRPRLHVVLWASECRVQIRDCFLEDLLTLRGTLAGPSSSDRNPSITAVTCSLKAGGNPGVGDMDCVRWHLRLAFVSVVFLGVN